MPFILKDKPVLEEVTVIVPVKTLQVGWVTLTVGVAGVAGCAFIFTLPDAGEVHPTELVTLNT